MSTKELSYAQKQQKTKPKIEDLIPLYITKEKQQAALDFAAWLRYNKMSPGFSGVTDTWKASCKGNNICKIYINQAKSIFGIDLYLNHIEKYKETVIKADLQNFVLDNILYCVQASKLEKPDDSLPMKYYGSSSYPCYWNSRGCGGKTMTILGKEIFNKCNGGNSQYYHFADPNEAEINAIKKLIELEKEARNNK